MSSAGLGVGGLWGLREGAARSLAVSNARLRLNSILNGVTRRGTFLGNSAGVLGRLDSAPHLVHLSSTTLRSFHLGFSVSPYLITLLVSARL